MCKLVISSLLIIFLVPCWIQNVGSKKLSMYLKNFLNLLMYTWNTLFPFKIISCNYIIPKYFNSICALPLCVFGVEFHLYSLSTLVICRVLDLSSLEFFFFLVVSLVYLFFYYLGLIFLNVFRSWNCLGGLVLRNWSFIDIHEL